MTRLDASQRKANGPLVTLEAAYILPLSIGNTGVRKRLADHVPYNLAWKYIQMFMGDTKIQGILHDIDVVETGIRTQRTRGPRVGD